jgi:subtilisin family serine protease
MNVRMMAGMAVVLACLPGLAAAPCLADSPARPDKSSVVLIPGSAQVVLYGFVPNDPYFRRNTPSAGWAGQWHLVNEFGTGIDANVLGAWARGITGAGVTIGIVDDCLQIAHPDLAPNYDAADSWDFGSNDGDPSPVNPGDMHGTSVAGVAAAKGGNSIGVVGAAPNAGLAGLRIDFDNQTVQMFIDATLYHSSGNNTSIKVKNHSYGYNTPYVDAAGPVTALETSAASGTIHVFAAGNQRSTWAQDTNTMQLQNSRAIIAVAALGSNGKYASYSSFGACVFVTAPASSASGLLRVTTTDVTGTGGYNNATSDSFPDDNYTSQFGGTSSASPLVAGVMALGKEVQPALNGRMAKHLLAMTSRIVNASDASESSDGGWRTNAAGRHFNQNYGFGLVDADAFTAAAVQYTGVSPLITEGTGTVQVGAAIPDNNLTGVTRTFTLNQDVPLEEVLVHLNITHTWRGDLEAYLTSPSGYTSRLLIWAGDPGDVIDWTFTTNAFWGEDPEGLWSLNVRDTWLYDLGTWNSYSATAYMGTLVPEPATLSLLALGGLALLRRKSGYGG